MKKLASNKKSFILIVFASIFIFIILFYVLFNMISNINLFGSRSGENIYADQNAPPEEENGEEISLLIEKTPHQGTNFGFIYDYETALFYVYINPSNPTAGNTEFDNFLEENGIEDRSQITALQVSDVPVPTPAP